MEIVLKSLDINAINSYIDLDKLYNLIKKEKLEIKFDCYTAYSTYDEKIDVGYITIFDNVEDDSFEISNMAIIMNECAKANLLKKTENNEYINNDVEFLNHLKNLNTPAISYSSLLDEEKADKIFFELINKLNEKTLNKRV